MSNFLKTLLAMVVLCVGLAINLSSANPAEPVIKKPWQEMVVSVSDIDRTAEFFTEIGGYTTKWRGPMSDSELTSWSLPKDARAETLLLGQSNRQDGYVRLVQFENVGRKTPTRPGARAWDTGCYFSMMVRMKGMSSIYDDAIKMGWWTETPITKHTFGKSELNIVVFKGPDGVQVQSYERLNLPIPEAFPDFERFSGPFNLMQMVRNKNETYRFYTDVLGFSTFYNGDPNVSEEVENMPLGIPKSLTTSVRYHAGIVYPQPSEVGRMEAIEIIDIKGNDYAERCDAPNLGILTARFEIDDLSRLESRLKKKQWPFVRAQSTTQIAPYGMLDLINIKTPDGANIQFYQVKSNSD